VEGVATGRLADSVVPVPVDAAAGLHAVRLVAGQRPGAWSGRQWVVDRVRHCRLVAPPTAVDVRRYLPAFGHSAVGDAAADEIAAVFADVIARQIEPVTASRRRLLA